MLLLACTGVEPESSASATETESGPQHTETGEDTAAPLLECAEKAQVCALVEGELGEEQFFVEVDDTVEVVHAVEVDCSEGLTLLLDGDQPRVWVTTPATAPGPLDASEGGDLRVSWSQSGGAYTQYGTRALVDTTTFDEVYGVGVGQLQRAELSTGGRVAGWVTVTEAWPMDHAGVRLTEAPLEGSVTVRFSATCP